MKWIRRLLALSAVLEGGLALLAGVRWWQLTQLPFNGEGRSFDPTAGIVSHRQDAVGWGLVALTALVGCGAAVVLWRRFGRRASSSSEATQQASK